MSDTSRLDTLEAALAHAERAISDLSDVATAQARDLEALRRENRALVHRLERLEASLAGDEQGEDFLPRIRPGIRVVTFPEECVNVDP